MNEFALAVKNVNVYFAWHCGVRAAGLMSCMMGLFYMVLSVLVHIFFKFILEKEEMHFNIFVTAFCLQHTEEVIILPYHFCGHAFSLRKMAPMKDALKMHIFNRT